MQQKTPSQQALIQFLESILITALIAGLVSISPLIGGAGPLNWTQIGVNFGLAIAFSLAHSLAAYLKATPAPGQGIDLAGLGNVIDMLVAKVQTSQSQGAQPVHGPTGVAITNAQPAQSTIQQASIPPFTSTAEIAALSNTTPKQ